MGHVSPLLMPKLGLTMTEGVITSWNVRVGSSVRVGDVLFTVETDKIAVDVEARGEGQIVTIELHEGERALVGQRIGSWSGPASDVAEPDNSSIGQLAPDSPPAPSSSNRVMASPAARRLASELDVDLKLIAGSGPRGRIIIKDVHRSTSLMKPSPSPTTQVAKLPLLDATASERTKSNKRGATPIEKLIARRLLESKETIPHFYVQSPVDITELIKLRGQLNADSNYPNRISINHLIIAAIARALVKFPEANTVWENEELITFASSDVGMVVNTDRGLLVPVVRDAGTQRLDTLAGECSHLVMKARDGRLTSSDLQGGALSVSNVGMFGAATLIPIINPGQSAMVGVGAPSGVFRPNTEGQPVLRQEISATMSCDHRVWNGVGAGKFLNAVRLLLEQPLSLLRG